MTPFDHINESVLPWTVRELDRQVSSQYYERMGLSKDKKALQKLAVKNAQQLAPRDILHILANPYPLRVPTT